MLAAIFSNLRTVKDRSETVTKLSITTRTTSAEAGTEFARTSVSDRAHTQAAGRSYLILIPGILGEAMDKQIRSALIVFCVLLVSVLARATVNGSSKPISFTILDPDNHEVIGHAEYRSEDLDGRIAVWGENDYQNGEHDIERTNLAFNDSDTLPVMENFEHTFFNADGSKKLMARADRRNGDASCISYQAGQKRDLSEKLQFPPDTYVGAAAVVAMEMAFRQGREQISFHTFDCTPGPTLAAVMAQRSQLSERWAHYPKPLIQVQLRAKLGWIGNFLGSLLPHRSAWFDPAHGWQYVGGKIQRYLARGPQVILVREEPGQRNAARDPSSGS
jgi:hypothetical protein